MGWTVIQFDACHTHINSQHTRTALARINWIGLASFWAPFSIVIESNNITYTMPKTVCGWFPPITAIPLLQLYSQLKPLYWHHTCECNLCRCLVCISQLQGRLRLYTYPLVIYRSRHFQPELVKSVQT